MKLLYLDASIVVATALSEKRRSPAIAEQARRANQLVSTELVVVEAQGAISFALANQPRDMVDAEQNLNRLLAAMTLSQADSIVLGHARNLVKRYRATLGLRTLDSIHLASANLIREGFSDQHGFSFTYLTADRKQHAAFSAEGHIGECLE